MDPSSQPGDWASVEALVGVAARGSCHPGVDHLRGSNPAVEMPAGRLQVLFVGNLTAQRRLTSSALAALPPDMATDHRRTQPGGTA
jgi:hypothetical protein